jgi:transcription elongation factor Elf1
MIHVTMQVIKTYVVCPHCNENSGGSIDHLIADHKEWHWGTWYCDNCGGGFAGTVTADGVVTVNKMDDSFSKCFDLLRIPPQKSPVYIVRSASHPTGREHAGTKYYYESHSCPTNWLTNIKMISIEGNKDPHGLIEYVGTAAFDQKTVDDCNHDWSETFPVIAVDIE